MNTLTHILITIVLLFFSTVTIAQQSDFPSSDKDMMKEQFAADLERLDLSEEQKADYLEISRRYGEQMMALRDSGAGRMAKYQELKSIRKDKDKEMKALLSKDQYAIYKDIQEERQQQMRERRKGGRM